MVNFGIDKRLFISPQQKVQHFHDFNPILRLRQVAIQRNHQFLIIVPDFPQRCQFPLTGFWSIHTFCDLDVFLLIRFRGDKVCFLIVNLNKGWKVVSNAIKGRLIRWCQFIMPEDLNGISTERAQGHLLALGLIRRYKKSGAFIMSKRGVLLLQALFADAPPNYPPSYHTVIIQRRLRLSKLALTAYRGSVDMFLDRSELLAETPSMFLSTLTRERGSNPWGSTRVAAIAHLGELFCAIHYVSPGIGKIALTDELNAFTNQTAQFHGNKRAFIFAGDSYGSILAELEALPSQTDAKLIGYGDAYRCLQFPVHLLPCDKTGAVQLQIMAIPDYRTRLARAALNDE